MKIDCGFFDINGNYKEDIQEVEMLSEKDLNEIKLLKAQNDGLKAQNDSLQKENAILKGKLDAFQMSENEANEIIAELKAENERLNRCLMESLQHEKDALDKSIKIKAENERLLKQKNKVMRKNVVLYTTLQEIKAIASKIIDSYIRPYGDYNQLKQILDLITKAEEE